MKSIDQFVKVKPFPQIYQQLHQLLKMIQTHVMELLVVLHQ